MNNNIYHTPGTPVELIPNDAILVFLQNGYFGPGPNSENIIDELPFILAGHMDFIGLMTLFRFYAHYNNLYVNNEYRSDEFLNYCFGEQYPAYYCYFLNREGRFEKLEMNTAVDLGVIDEPLNSYQVLRGLTPEFNGDVFSIQILTGLIEVNAGIREVDEIIAEGIRQDNDVLINARRNVRPFLGNSNRQVPNGYGMEKIRTIMQGRKTKNARF